jgi:hypothetical protein
VSVYVAMICDRHADPEPFVFSAAEAAIAYAREQARTSARGPGDVLESEIEGWLYHASYSNEGDSVWVIEREIDQP